MNGSALTLWLVSLALPAQMLTPSAQRVDSLIVISREPVLGEEIARAARRYLHRPTQVRRDAEANGKTDSAGTVRLQVETESGIGSGLRFQLTLSQGMQRVQRSLPLRETPNRIDLAEAIAIELPALLSQLAEQGKAASVPTVPVPTPLPPPKRTLPSVNAPLLAMKTSPAKVAGVHIPAPKETESVAKPAMADSTQETPKPADAQPQTETESAPASTPDPRAATTAEIDPKETAPKDAVPKESGESPKKSPEETPSADAKQPDVLVAAPIPDGVRSKRPAGAVGLMIGGGAVLLAGVGTGIETLLVAKQVSQPTTDGHFDSKLDQQGKTLSAVTIALDAVGGAALLAGSVWLYVNAQRAAKQSPAKKRVTVAPLFHKSSVGILSEVRF